MASNSVVEMRNIILLPVCATVSSHARAVKRSVFFFIVRVRCWFYLSGVLVHHNFFWLTVTSLVFCHKKSQTAQIPPDFFLSLVWFDMLCNLSGSLLEVFHFNSCQSLWTQFPSCCNRACCVGKKKLSRLFILDGSTFK